MRTIKARPSELLTAIRGNYEKHKRDYAEAFEGYKIEVEEAVAQVREQFSAHISAMLLRVKSADLAKGQKPAQPHFTVPTIGIRPPVDHSADYEVVIRMLEFEQSDLVDIEADQFECYVMDRWGWKEEFQASHALYANSLSKRK